MAASADDTQINEDFLNIFDGQDETMVEVDDVVKQMSESIRVRVEDTMHRIADIWIQIGLPSSRRNARMDEIIELIDSTFFGCFETEQASLAHLINYKETRFKQINEMLSALHLPSYSMPTDCSLLALGKLLKAKFDELEKVRVERMDKLSELRQKREYACKRLGESVPPFNLKTSIPSEEELVDLQASLSKLQTELRKRKQEFITIKQSFDDIAAELEFEPKSDFEKEVASGTEETFTLSKANIKKFVELQNRLDKENEQNLAKKREMFERLQYLWDRLSIEESERLEILAQYALNSKRILESLKTDQLEKFEAIRKSRIGEFINNIEPETREWWTKCFISMDEQERILLHFSDFEPESEELLEAWEKELARLKAFYAEFEHVFKDIELIYNCWDELEEIERAENDPDRYKNRRIPSTQIMKEQQRKRKLENQIKKIEKEMVNLSAEQEKNGQAIIIGGTILGEYVLARRTAYEEAKENEKQAKKMEKALKMQEEQFGRSRMPKGGIVLKKTPVKRTLTTTSITSSINSPLSPAKLRRINGQPGPSSMAKSSSNLKAMGPPSATKSITASKLKPSSTYTHLRPGQRTTPQMSKALSGSQQSLLSVCEEEFQAGLTRRRRAPELNSTYIRKDIDKLRL